MTTQQLTNEQQAKEQVRRQLEQIVRQLDCYATLRTSKVRNLANGALKLLEKEGSK
jgi:hypothetical protein